MKKMAVGAVGGLLFWAGSAWGQAKVGTAGLQFLEIGVSARATAMGGAFAALASDAFAVYYNAAGLAAVGRKQAALSHIDYPAGIHYEFAAMALPVRKLGGVMAISLYDFQSGDIPVTTYNFPSGTGETTKAQDLAVAVTFARYLTDHFSFGITGKFIQESLADREASGWAADVGTLYETGFRNFRIAMRISNFGPNFTFGPSGENFKDFPLPIDFHFGTAIDVVQNSHHRTTLAFEGSHPADNLEKFNGGLEYWYSEKLALRLGVYYRQDTDAQEQLVEDSRKFTVGTGLAAGAGFKFPVQRFNLTADYAYQQAHDLGSFHRWSVLVSF
ncbi:MAG: PorV/PorQ family protein [candidate division Zixibacteria bacterium]|nr:PorV/PorQ family protein [candidate division Zixibacteria bacterium]